MKIELNKKLDKEVYLAFCDTVVGGADFGQKIRDDHTNITKENYIEYIDDFYMTNSDELRSVLKDTELCFDEIKDSLFFELEKYFGKDYSKENYTCYLSIFNCNSRYLENKSFQVYYKRSHDMCKEVIAHELAHFAFYDFCDNLGIKNDNSVGNIREDIDRLWSNGCCDPKPSISTECEQCKFFEQRLCGYLYYVCPGIPCFPERKEFFRLLVESFKNDSAQLSTSIKR